MGERGPAPMPSALKDNPDNQDEPKPIAVEIGQLREPPDDLTVHGKEKWNQMLPILVQMRVMTNADYEALEKYCDMSDRYQKAVDHIRQYGQVIEGHTDRGAYKIQANPACQIENKLFTAMFKILQDFGFTPASRVKMKAQPKQKPKGGKLQAWKDKKNKKAA